MNTIIKEGLVLNIYRTNFSKLISFYNKLGISSIEIVNTENQEDYVKDVNKIKNLQIEITNVYNNLLNVDFENIQNDYMIETVSILNDSILFYNTIYSDKIKISIDQLIEYKYLTLHPEQIEEDYNSLMIEQQNLGILTADYSNRTKEEVIAELLSIYEYSINNYKIYIFKILDNQEYLINKIIFSINKEIAHRNEVIAGMQSNITKLSMILIFLSLTFIILISIIIANSVSSPLLEVNKILEKISKGLIPEDIEVNRTDEIGVILDSVNELTKHLNENVRFSQEISEGNFKYEYIPAGLDDVLGNSLIQLRESLIHANREEEKRRLDDLRRKRDNEGVSLFSEILRQNQDNLKKLGREVVSNLVKFLKANQAVLFVSSTDEQDPFLNLISAYAWNREKFIDKRIAVGDGLIGSVALEKFTVYMTDVPEDYIEITSGTGSANPKSILIVPIKIDEEVLGVVEIASFNEIEQYEIEIVEHIAENIASTLKSVQISDQTSELLEKFQIQASEMKEQEMALKGSIQELQKSDNERKNRENELAKKLKEIKELNKQVQFKDEQLHKEVDKLKLKNKNNIKKQEVQTQNMKEIIDKMSMSVVIIKMGGIIEFANTKIEKFLGYKRFELVDTNIESLLQSPPNIGEQKLCEYLFSNMDKINKKGGSGFFINNKNETIDKVILELAVIGIDEEQRMVIYIKDKKLDNRKQIQTSDYLENIFKKDFENTLKLNHIDDYLKKQKISIPKFELDYKEIIKWGSKYKLGISLIDNQHKKWIGFINNFFYNLIMNADENTINKTLVELREYTEYHFSFEEKYMKEFGYSEIEKHGVEHKKFVDSLSNYFSEYASGDKATIHKLIYFLIDWVTDHVLVKDAKYVSLFNKHGLK
ncbi:MAG: bacteriohemerythrin [Bacteroidota bacterium]|nr:bacteriohemerythrin [Bacteroidota bacterium]